MIVDVSKENKNVYDEKKHMKLVEKMNKLDEEKYVIEEIIKDNEDYE